MAKGKPGRAQAAMRQARLTEAAAEGRVATAAPTGLLVAEGDSWFDHPLNDVLSVLEDEHGFDLEAVAHKGDTVEHMAYGADQFDGFIRLLEKILKRGDVPDAILLSGGGNDIAGGEFTILINHVRGRGSSPGFFRRGIRT